MAKIRAQLKPISTTLSWIRWSRRIASIEDGQRRKTVAYIAFNDLETANAFRAHVLKRGLATPYNRDTDSGINKPRKAERLNEYAYEIKWHRPDPSFMESLIRRDIKEAAAAARADLGI